MEVDGSDDFPFHFEVPAVNCPEGRVNYRGGGGGRDFHHNFTWILEWFLDDSVNSKIFIAKFAPWLARRGGTGRLDRAHFQSALQRVFGHVQPVVPQPDATWCRGEGRGWNAGGQCLQYTKPSSRWWFQILFIFTPTWGRFPFWLIFFKRGWNHQPVLGTNISQNKGS